MPVGHCRISREQPRGDNLVFSGRIVGKPEVIQVGPIGNDKSACRKRSPRLTSLSCATYVQADVNRNSTD